MVIIGFDPPLISPWNISGIILDTNKPVQIIIYKNAHVAKTKEYTNEK